MLPQVFSCPAPRIIKMSADTVSSKLWRSKIFVADYNTLLEVPSSLLTAGSVWRLKLVRCFFVNLINPIVLGVTSVCYNDSHDIYLLTYTMKLRQYLVLHFLFLERLAR